MTEQIETYSLNFGNKEKYLVGKNATLVRNSNGNNLLTMRVYVYSPENGPINNRKSWRLKETSSDISDYDLENYIKIGRLTKIKEEFVFQDRFDRIED